ncbi:cation-translocating P-type ATPase [Sphingorhabdus sp. M41]|uniref:cation-translocating P-type ATPase n=1 Tax=Sphingorhabdus sp. M41 TaxID=1806885 RepID=UPI00078EB916|nr:cation-translocating P-type ATPase [Sphingorhabdus sp. M41]AMO73314.1 ATPase [Sphingorhabdus sp. M41]
MHIAAEPADDMQMGLSSEQVRERYARYGPNELPHHDERSILRIVGEVLREPMLALLLAAGFAYLLLGDRIEAILLLCFATFSVAISVIQETRSERVLAALRDLSSPRALVIRDGKRLRIPGREVVVGDIIILEQGDRVAADALLLSATELEIDESLLTGESLAVHKDVEAEAFSGTLVVRGTGIGEVVAIGGQTQIGQIGGHLADIKPDAPRLRRETGFIVKLAGIGGILIAASVTLIYGFSHGGWLDAVLAGIAIGMAMLPEEFPVVLVTFMAMGAWRISKANVLTRRSAAIETLGSVTILCTDKTGTLTENKMAVATMWLPEGLHLTVDRSQNIPGSFQPLLKASLWASEVEPSDPMDIAIHSAASALLPGKDNANDQHWHLERHFGIRPDLLATTNMWLDGPAHEDRLLAAKGAPEAIAQLCRLSDSEQKEMMRAVEDMAAKGIRVLGVATVRAKEVDDYADLLDYRFALAGLIGLADPLRASVPEAIGHCRDAGIRVLMITGDHAATARSIASDAGIESDNLITGSELAGLDDDELGRRLRTTNIFARIMPEQKLRLVRALKSDGEVVAMTGDGVNDAPSLKAAHVGIAMGGRGTDVAREASSLVLLDDEFTAIVSAIRLGRRIYDNIRKAMEFIFAAHVPIAGLALLPLMFGLPMLLGPIHIALLEMVIDPACALVFEAEEEDDEIMRRSPRHPEARLFSLPMVIWSIFQGALALGALTLGIVIAVQQDMPVTELRALAFLTLIASLLALILANRSSSASLRSLFDYRNKALLAIFGAVIVVMMVIYLFEPARSILGFAKLSIFEIVAVIGYGFILLSVLQILKPLVNRILQEASSSDRN